MKKHPIWYLIIGIIILIVPTLIYLYFLVPQLTDEYNVLMTSGGVIGGIGLYGTDKIPENLKYSSLFKTASRSFTIMTVSVLIEKFYGRILGLVCVFLVSFIIYKIFVEVWKDARTKLQSDYIAEKIARSINKTAE